MKAHGHDEEEIADELKNIKNGELWVGFDDVNLKKPGNHSNKD